jgi:putative FmdB family regulatory protein
VPTYAYRCTACNHRFDAFQRMTDDPLTTCPSCTGFVKRTIQNVPVVFKGSGWYITDSRKGSNGKTETADKPGEAAETKDAKPAGGETEKPAAKAKAAKSEAAAAAAD